MALKYILDNAGIIRNRRVLDVGCGCGAGAIAAAINGAKRIVANDIDPYALEASRINAKLNKIKIETDVNNYIDSSCEEFDVILVGDMFYEEQFARMLFRWLNSLAAYNKLVLIGDPGRHGLTEGRRSQLRLLARYDMTEQTRHENNGFTDTAVWQLNKL